MAILTFNDLVRIRNRINKGFILKEAKTYTATKSVFLSHSSADQEHLPEVIAFLEEHGASVYVDVRDERMPQPPSPQTALILKGRINQCPRFVVLLTDHSRQSKWVPWEIGFADACRGMIDIALLAVDSKPDEPLWLRQEYLGLYPVIRNSTPTMIQPTWHVEDPRDRSKFWPLTTWLTAGKLG